LVKNSIQLYPYICRTERLWDMRRYCRFRCRDDTQIH